MVTTNLDSVTIFQPLTPSLSEVLRHFLPFRRHAAWQVKTAFRRLAGLDTEETTQPEAGLLDPLPSSASACSDLAADHDREQQPGFARAVFRWVWMAQAALDARDSLSGRRRPGLGCLLPAFAGSPNRNSHGRSRGVTFKSASKSPMTESGTSGPGPGQDGLSVAGVFAQPSVSLVFRDGDLH